MKKRTALLIICLLTPCLTTSPKWNCFDKSRHLQESYDTKTYAPPIGGCTCDCDREQARGMHSKNRDKCIQCNHFHDPAPQYIVSAQPKNMSKLNGIWYKNPLLCIKTLIAKYHTKK